MLKNEYLFFAEDLANRNKHRLKTECDPKELETDELFYWITTRLTWSIRGCWPAKKHHLVDVELTHWLDDGSAVLEHGQVSKFVSDYVKGKDFYEVMDNVANIFNKIGLSEEKGYLFRATFILPENRYQVVRLVVSMETIC